MTSQTPLKKRLVNKETIIKEIEKKISNSKLAESHYNDVLLKFTKQAKDQYLKYEAYLDNSEDLLNYTLTFFHKAIELVDKVIEGATVGSKIDFRSHFKLEGGVEIETNLKRILEKFTRSQFLTKKKLFLDIKKRMDLKSNLKLHEYKKKFDRFLDTEIERNLTDPGKKSFMMSSDIYERKRAKTKVESGKDVYKKLMKEMVSFGDILEKKNNDWFGKNKIEDLKGNIRNLITGIRKHLLKKKESMKKEIKDSLTTKEEKNDYGLDSDDIDVEGLMIIFNEKEKIEYNKLTRLREKNAKLTIIQNHIKNLSKENTKLNDNINNNEFNLIVNNEIIMAYEKSIIDKEEKINEKVEEIASLDSNLRSMNEKIVEQLNSLIGKLTRLR